MTNCTSRAVAPVSSICAAFRTQPSAYPPEATKPDVAPVCGSVRQSYSTEAGAPAGGFRRRNEPQAAKQPAMDLSRDKNAEEMKWSPLEMGAAMQAHGA
ncbi:MAG: hypothetical protein ACLR8L_08205 [Oscillospiraceae bacterium]